MPAFRHVYSGKIRDVYEAGDGQVLLVASDRVSAYDVVLPTPIPEKGKILTQLSLWWFEQLVDLVPHHVISTDVPPEFTGRAMVCRRLEMVPVECVARGYLAGSGLVDYRAGGAICGVGLPVGLVEGSRLPEPIFTPASKAGAGEHDENITYLQVADSLGTALAEELRRITLAVYARGAAVAARAGLILADTKIELGHDGAGNLRLGDEVMTPDSARFWPADRWLPGRPQPSYDKQYLRNWLTDSGWDRRPPGPELPEPVVAATRARYVEAYQLLTGQPWT
ncbi:MAG: phosphoribosylaminoimidazolesuccinocarboxamide synthase [Actinomycetota bacterium]|nr:phosphoribosylaminoimidazolesuccinocarboxamide synthase [Actinomycetota bacterium]